MKTYKFKLYENKKNRYLKRSINASASIWNHCIALHKRYYKMFKKHLNKYQLMKHIAKLRKKINYWQQVGSQAVQDICDRIQKAYELFFKFHKRGVKPPSFCKSKKYKSFTLKQAGYKFLSSNRIKIGSRIFKFHLSKEIKGKVKIVTIKRSAVGELYIAVVTDFIDESFGVTTGKSAGFDFGLKTFLTDNNGIEYKSPLFLLKASKLIQKASKKLSSKKLGSNNWHKARIQLAQLHEHIANQRRDYFWKLAHQLCDTYDYLFIVMPI
jgi:putative transposase